MTKQQQLDAMTAHLAECDAIFEEARTEALADIPPQGSSAVEKARRRAAVVNSVAVALVAKLEHLDTAPKTIEASIFAPHRAGLVAQIKTHRIYHDKVRAELEALEKEARRGKDIAKRNAVIGLRKVLANIRDERERHELSAVKLTSPDAIEREAQRHERAVADLSLKADACMSALLAAL